MTATGLGLTSRSSTTPVDRRLTTFSFRLGNSLCVSVHLNWSTPGRANTDSSRRTQSLAAVPCVYLGLSMVSDDAVVAGLALTSAPYTAERRRRGAEVVRASAPLVHCSSARPGRPRPGRPPDLLVTAGRVRYAVTLDAWMSALRVSQSGVNRVIRFQPGPALPRVIPTLESIFSSTTAAAPKR